MSEFLGTIEPWAALWGENMGRASLQGGLAIAAAWGLSRWCRFLSARVTCWIWRLACLKLLVALCCASRWTFPFWLPNRRRPKGGRLKRGRLRRGSLARLPTSRGRRSARRSCSGST